MSDIPLNVPVDTVKLRIEKTAARRIPTEAFYYLVELRYLWITYNSITSVDTGSFYNLKVLHELRLDGNMISMFPWESLKEMPRLRTLDLHNNRLTTVPNEAIPYLLNITYLDLSSNKLTTLPSDLMDIWPPFNGAPTSMNASQKVVLGKVKMLFGFIIKDINLRGYFVDHCNSDASFHHTLLVRPPDWLKPALVVTARTQHTSVTFIINWLSNLILGYLIYCLKSSMVSFPFETPKTPIISVQSKYLCFGTRTFIAICTCCQHQIIVETVKYGRSSDLMDFNVHFNNKKCLSFL